MTMPINVSDNNNIPTDTDAYYEERASQEELYLEETEEEVVAILTSYVSAAPQNDLSIVTEYCGFRESDLEVKESITNPKNDPCIVESLDAQKNHAAEELISGDSDDPPLSEEAVVEMLRMTPIPKASGL